MRQVQTRFSGLTPNIRASVSFSNSGRKASPKQVQTLFGKEVQEHLYGWACPAHPYRILKRKVLDNRILKQKLPENWIPNRILKRKVPKTGSPTCKSRTLQF